MTGTTLHNRWREFRARCRNPNHRRYKDYGGRGISVAAEWEDFSAFAAWALISGFRPDCQLDRVDNDGPYSPDNCRWVPPAQNARNRRDNRRYSFFGKSMVVADAAAMFGMAPQTLTDRLDRGLTPEMAVSTKSFCEPQRTKSDTIS